MAEEVNMSDPASADVDALTRILDTLVPQKNVIVCDATGAEHRLPGALPARRQIEVLRKLEVLKNVALEDPGVQALVASFKAGETEERELMGSIVDVLVTLAADEDVLASLAEAFDHAHPSAVANARIALQEIEGGTVTGDPADLFPLEEIISGLIPFFVRLLKRGAEALGAFTQASKTTAQTTAQPAA